MPYDDHPSPVARVGDKGRNENTAQRTIDGFSPLFDRRDRLKNPFTFTQAGEELLEVISVLFDIDRHVALPNESRLRCGALKKDSLHNLRAPAASSAC